MLDGQHVISERPECAKLIGAIIVEWSSAEANLAHYYATLLFGPPLQRVVQQPGHWAAFETFDLLVSFGQRKKMLMVAAERRGFDAATIKEFGKYIGILDKTGSDRVIAAHGRWGLDPNYPSAVVWTKTIGSIAEAMIYEPADFEQMITAINKANWRLHEFFYASLFPRLEQHAEVIVDRIRATKKP